MRPAPPRAGSSAHTSCNITTDSSAPCCSGRPPTPPLPTRTHTARDRPAAVPSATSNTRAAASHYNEQSDYICRFIYNPNKRTFSKVGGQLPAKGGSGGAAKPSADSGGGEAGALSAARRGGTTERSRKRGRSDQGAHARASSSSADEASPDLVGATVLHPSTDLKGTVVAQTDSWFTVEWEDRDRDDLSQQEVVPMLTNQSRVTKARRRTAARPLVSGAAAASSGGAAPQRISPVGTPSNPSSPRSAAEPRKLVQGVHNALQQRAPQTQKQEKPQSKPGKQHAAQGAQPLSQAARTANEGLLRQKAVSMQHQRQQALLVQEQQRQQQQQLKQQLLQQHYENQLYEQQVWQQQYLQQQLQSPQLLEQEQLLQQQLQAHVLQAQMQQQEMDPAAAAAALQEQAMVNAQMQQMQQMAVAAALQGQTGAYLYGGGGGGGDLATALWEQQVAAIAQQGGLAGSQS